MTARIPQSVREEQLNALPGKRFVRWDGTYNNNLSKAVMQCDHGHEWAASAGQLLAGRGCPKCSGKYVFSKSEREGQLCAIPGARFVAWADGFTGSHSKARMKCLHDGCEWVTTVHALLKTGTGCPKCAGNYRYSRIDREGQLSSIPNVKFVGWVRGYKNISSRARMRCLIDGHEWDSSVRDLICSRKGCIKCANRSMSDARRTPSDVRENQISSIPSVKFVAWSGEGYRNNRSYAKVVCENCGHRWATMVSVLIGGAGCPKCAQYGFNPGLPGTLYALRSECGSHVKVGISNDFERRLSELVKRTPFQFEVVARLDFDGESVQQLERLFHRNFKSSNFRRFDGATEWLKFDSNILSLMQILGA